MNPAVSVGLWAGGRFPARDLFPYIAAQVIGGISPGHYSLMAGFIAEVAMTFGFLFLSLGSTHGRAPRGFAPIAIGLCLTLMHLIGAMVAGLLYRWLGRDDEPVVGEPDSDRRVRA